MDAAELTDTERAYVEGRSQTMTKAEAFRLAGISHAAYYLWPKERRAYLDGLARDYKCNMAARDVPDLRHPKRRTCGWEGN